MLTEQPKSRIQITKGELELALLENDTWEIAQDVENNSHIVETRTFTFGEQYGIVKKDDYSKSFINISGKSWYLTTIKETSMPILKSITNKLADYMELREVVEYQYALAW